MLPAERGDNEVAPRIRKGATIIVDVGEPMYRRIEDIRVTPDGVELVLKEITRKTSERRWAKRK